MDRQQHNNFRIDPVKQQIAYINGIGRNRFHNWDEFAAKMLLNRYASDLRKYGLNDDEILEKNLLEQVNPFTKSVKNWKAWTRQIEAWTKEIDSWERDDQQPIDRSDYFSRAEQTLMKSSRKNEKK